MLDDHGRHRLEAAYHEFGDDVWRAIVAYSGGRRDVADDAVAEAFAQAARGLERIRELRPWLFRAAFRIAAGELQRRTVTLVGEPDHPREPGGGTEEMTEMMELVHALSPAQRRAFVLRDLLGYRTSEAASLAGSSDVSIRVHLHAARRRLRIQLEEAAR